MGKRSATYITKQREAILNYLETQKNTHLTAAQIVEHFENNAATIGRTTIYRQLERLFREGAVHRYFIEGIIGACFQFVPVHERQQECFHFKCEQCGNVSNFHCGTLEEISRHLMDSHEFQINDGKTVFYGKCKACL